MFSVPEVLIVSTPELLGEWVHTVPYLAAVSIPPSQDSGRSQEPDPIVNVPVVFTAGGRSHHTIALSQAATAANKAESQGPEPGYHQRAYMSVTLPFAKATVPLPVKTGYNPA
jgi:hypothetical protein